MTMRRISSQLNDTTRLFITFHTIIMWLENDLLPEEKPSSITFSLGEELILELTPDNWFVYKGEKIDDAKGLYDVFCFYFGQVAQRQNELITASREAMQEFVNRVDKWEVRSTYTYNKFKDLLVLFNKYGQALSPIQTAENTESATGSGEGETSQEIKTDEKIG